MARKMELKDQSVEELQALFHDLSKEIYELRCELKLSRKLDKPHLLKQKRKDRARILTLLNQRGEG